MSGSFAELDLAEAARSASGSEVVSQEPAGGGPSASGVNAAASGPVGLTAGTGTFADCLPTDTLTGTIDELKAKQKQLREEKQELAKNLRNAERRRKRLRTKAARLTEEDLVQVLMIRKTQKQEREKKLEAAGAGGSSSSSSSGLATSL